MAQKTKKFKNVEQLTWFFESLNIDYTKHEWTITAQKNQQFKKIN